MPRLADKERFIPKNLGGTDNLYDDLPLVGSVQVKDGFIALIPVVIGLYATPAIPETFGQYRLILVGLGLSISASLLLAKPHYLTLSEWISVRRSYRKRPKEHTRNLDQTIASVKTNEEPDTREQIGVEKIYPEYGVVEKPNGDMLTYIRMSGVNLDILAGKQEWEDRAYAFKDVLETHIQDDIQLYMPMRQYDPSEQISLFNNRLENPKIKENPFMVNYLLDRMDFHQIIAEEGFYRRYYCVVRTKKTEVVSESDYRQTGIEAFLDNISPKLKEIYVDAAQNSRGYLSNDEIIQKQLEIAVDKAGRVGSSFEGQVAGSTKVLGGNEVGVLLKEVWTGRTIGREEEQNFLREDPIIMGPESMQDRDNNEGD